jgi:hypothetical protein
LFYRWHDLRLSRVLAATAADKRYFRPVDASADVFALAVEWHADMIGMARAGLGWPGRHLSTTPH